MFSYASTADGLPGWAEAGRTHWQRSDRINLQAGASAASSVLSNIGLRQGMKLSSG